MLLNNHELTKTAQMCVVWLKQLLHFFSSKIKPFFLGGGGFWGVLLGCLFCACALVVCLFL